jgi:hypothetical protein
MKREQSAADGSRRQFLGRMGLVAGALAVAGSGRSHGQAGSGSTAGAAGTSTAAYPEATAAQAGYPPTWFPQQDLALVKAVVGASHGNLDEVRRLVGARPELARAPWDWGYGDWESPLDAAAHTGRHEIAHLLIANGARPTLFSAAMLGQLEVVKAFITASPGVEKVRGAHGIPLLSHAKVGGPAAAPVVAYLEALGSAGGSAELPLDPAEAERYVGTYRFGPAAGDALEVAVGSMGLAIARAGGGARRLINLGGHAFHPAGAESVRVRFEVAGGRAVAVAVYDPDLLVRGTLATASGKR